MKDLMVMGIDVSTESDLTFFDNRFGDIDGYDAVLAHPSTQMLGYFLNNFREEHPGLPIAFVGVEAGKIADIQIFGYPQADEIIDYFNKEVQKHKRESEK